MTSRVPFFKPQFLQKAGGYSEPYLLLGEILELWAVAKSPPRLSGVPAFYRPRLATGTPPCETHMCTPLRKAEPGLYLVTPDLEFHLLVDGTPFHPAFAQLLGIESVGGQETWSPGPAEGPGRLGLGDDLASC